MKTTTLKKEFEFLKTERSTIEQTWLIIEKLIAPFRGEFFDDITGEHSVDWRKREIYDGTAVMANQTLAASVHGSLTSASIRWFNMIFREAELNDNKEASEWLEECGDLIYQALQDSNFDLEITECYMDLTSFGTSVVVEEALAVEGWEGLDFQTIPIKECFFTQDHKGNILRLYRMLDWTPDQIISKFGEENVPKHIIDKASGNNSSERIKVIFCVYARDNKKNADVNTVLSPNNRPFASTYFLLDSAEKLGVDGGYYEMPAFVPRWRKVSGSKWGYSPSMVSLSDVLTLNELVEMTLVAKEKAIDPPSLTTERGLLSDLDLEASGLTVVRNINDLKAYESKARFDVGDVTIASLQNAIRGYFHVDQLELKESPAMTATEVQVRYELIQRLLGPTMGRLQNDLLDPIISRTFNMMFRAGAFPKMPDIVKERQGQLHVQYTGPLSRAQKMDEVAAIERFVGTIGAMAEQYPEIMDNVNPDGVASSIHQLLGTTNKVLRDEKEIQTVRTQRAAAAQKQAQMEQVSQIADAAGKIGVDASQMGAQDGQEQQPPAQ